MCYQPICDITCQEKVFPAGIIHALHLKNEAGTVRPGAQTSLRDRQPTVHPLRALYVSLSDRGHVISKQFINNDIN